MNTLDREKADYKAAHDVEARIRPWVWAGFVVVGAVCAVAMAVVSR